MKSFLLAFCLTITTVVFAQEQLNIVPYPNSVQIGTGNLELKKGVALISHLGKDGNSSSFTKLFSQSLFNITKVQTTSAASPGAIKISFFPSDAEKNYGTEYYKIIIDKNGVVVNASSEKGAFYATQTLLQLITRNKEGILTIPYVTIEDKPRFEHRAMHLDVGRHFFTIKEVKQYIDYLALHKMNRFHWHLTEDQGWRIEIKKYPLLTKVGGWRNGTIIGRYPGKGNDNKFYGGIYTQEEIKDVVKYAADRYIEVIPEIEMPGHSSAAIAAYPYLSCFPEKPTAIPSNMISEKSKEELRTGRIKLTQETWGVFDDVFCAGKESTFKFLEDVIDEVMPLFPSKYFHIGGDECPKTHWKICPLCQAKIKELGLKNEHELQSYFVQRIEKYLNSKGKDLIGWDEILEGGLAPNAIVMSWRGEDGGIQAAKENHRVIMSPGSPLYFDHSQSENEDSVTIGGYNPLNKVYSYNPVPAALSEEQGKYIMGAQANVWTEYMDNFRKVQYMIFPRIAALSEVLWTEKENKSWGGFEKRLPAILKRYEKMGVEISNAYYDIKPEITPNTTNDGLLLSLSTKAPNGWLTFNINQIDTIETYKNPIAINQSQTVYASFSDTISHEGKSNIQIEFKVNKATGRKITLTNQPSKSYPGDGAFTLVNGIQNTKGTAKSKEFLGFSGTDLDATIDLGSTQQFSEVAVHFLVQKTSWIWAPKSAVIMISEDGINFHPVNSSYSPDLINAVNGNNAINFVLHEKARYIRVIAENQGLIADGNAGAGNKAWLFIDEIEVK
jgi:hexosaminidase